MNNGDRSAQIVRFGVFEADLQTGELRRNGSKVSLQGQPFQVCAILLEHSGELVTREELRQKVWPQDTFVDFDHALNTAITKIRAALGDEADNPRFVETLPRRGYRFIAPVHKAISEPTALDVSEARSARLGANGRWLVASAILLILISGIGISRFSRRHAEESLPPLEIVPMAAVPGFEHDPAFSPDGNQVAFALDGEDGGGIYTTIVGGEKTLRLTKGNDYSPTWSPDGRRVAFYRDGDHGTAIYAVPALGGTEQRLYAGLSSAWTTGLHWSPDGKALVFTDSHGETNHTWISLLSLADSSTRKLTSPAGSEIDYSPAFSPDGSTVAFVRGSLVGVVSDLYVVPAAGGVPKRLSFDNTWILGPPTWTPDGREIVFSSDRGGGLNCLWRVSSNGGPLRPVASVGVIAWSPSISPKGNQLVYQRMFFKDNLFRLNLRDETHPEGPPILVKSDKGFNWRPHFSPDGKRFTVESNGLGHSEIWACDSVGANCGQLTSLRGTAGAARWSPDGRYIAFEYRPKDRSEVYLLEVGGGAPRLLPTLPGANNGGPSWSRDGKWIYFYSDKTGEPFQLWKVSSEGGPPVQITKHGGVFAVESDDGRFLYFVKFDASGVWRIPLGGGQEERILPSAGGHEWFNWALTRNGIYFRDSNESKNHALIGVLEFFDFATRKTTTVTATDQPGGVGLAVSPDGRSILYDDKGDAESTIMLVKNFR
ncbi:MAG TPA: winged helix-turn-helix domain-containing protein [Terriglobales bacterium]|nr:winged helix-turn-helix domain-containing protein [Terriglobales bacterium]